MFSNIGWFEIFGILIVGLIVLGPERLPEVVKDVRAALFAARKAINNAKKELDGEFGQEFEEFKKPIGQLAALQRMGPKAALTKALFDGDGEFLDSFDPRKIMAEDTAGQAYPQSMNAPESYQVQRSSVPMNQQVPPPTPAPPTRPAPTPPQQAAAPQQPTPAPQDPPQPHSRGEFSWDDIT